MITVLKKGTTDAQMQTLIDWLRAQNLEVHISRGSELTVLGLIGDTTHVDMDLIASLDIVDSCKRVSEPFKKCSRKFQPEDTVIEIGSADTEKVKVAKLLGWSLAEMNDFLFDGQLPIGNPE